MQKKVNPNGHRSRLRARFERSGFTGFNDYEIIELILTLCIPRKDVKQPAKALLEKFGSIGEIFDASPADLETVDGIGKIAPIAIKIIKEAASVYLLHSVKGQIILNNSEKLEAFWQSRLINLRHEVFEVAYLDNSYRLLKNGIERIEEGTTSHTVVYPRKVIGSALKNGAAAIVLAHNHPGGTTQPSTDDFKLTKALINAANTLNIEVIDHIIIADKEIFSFRRNGYIS